MSSYYQKNKEKLLNRAKNITKITKKDWENKQEINIENYLTKKKTQRERMEEIDIKICLKKINKDYKNIKKITVKKKNLRKKLLYFFLYMV